MLRTQTRISSQAAPSTLSSAPARTELNAIDDTDQFITAEPTPTMESRRGWRRRRIARGKS
ncbi:MAG: hypothetical protein AAFV37_06635 [Pseudomonadota bacterium]